MPGAGNRRARLGQLLKETLSERILRDVKDPRVAAVQLLTVTAVDVSPDLRHARVMCSIVGERQAGEEAIRGLQSASGFLRSALMRELRTKVTPELHFVLDEGAAHAERVEAVLRELKSEEGASGALPGPGTGEEESVTGTGKER